MAPAPRGCRLSSPAFLGGWHSTSTPGLAFECCQFAQADGVRAGLSVGVFVVAFKEGRTTVNDYEIDTAELVDFYAELIHFF